MRAARLLRESATGVVSTRAKNLTRLLRGKSKRRSAPPSAAPRPMTPAARLAPLHPEAERMSAISRFFVAEPLLRQQLQRGNALRLRSRGTSMLPLLRSGDVVGIVAARRYGDGDVLAYVRGETVIVHRLIGRAAGGGPQGQLRLRGDARRWPDQPVAAESVLGRVDWVERDGRVIRVDGPWGRLCGGLSRLSPPGQPLLAEALRG